jgi:endoglucanase
VTGYGKRPLEHPHHRFWAHQANAKFPSAPPGIVSGGPNSGLQDPYVQAAGLAGCAPEKCFADNIEAWSANEIAINWNAPLAWVASFLDEKAEGKVHSAKPPKDKGARAKK